MCVGPVRRLPPSACVRESTELLCVCVCRVWGLVPVCVHVCVSPGHQSGHERISQERPRAHPAAHPAAHAFSDHPPTHRITTKQSNVLGTARPNPGTECREPGVGWPATSSSGGSYWLQGVFYFGTAPLAENSGKAAPKNNRPCVVGCLLDLDATPARMTVFVDGEPLAVQCEYDFPKDGRAWFPTVSLGSAGPDLTALHSCAI